MALPTQTDTDRGLFDRFAHWVAAWVARAPFFVFCVGLVAVWLISYPLVGDFDRWSLWINNPSTTLTLLLLALLQNSTARADMASQTKLNAIADGLADLMDRWAERYDDDEMRADVIELREAVGLETRVSS